MLRSSDAAREQLVQQRRVDRRPVDQERIGREQAVARAEIGAGRPGTSASNEVVNGVPV